ncbi:MAG: ABC transporter permease [Firmicutes bacterium]|nr:ABC transporter permease [Bacillota bacterium]
MYRYVHLRMILTALAGIYLQRRLILNLAKNDFKTRFAGSYFGIIWAFVQPVCTILVFWFVFQIGFRNPNVGDIPYVLWFMAGLIPWFFFSEAWNGATNAFIEYSYLVKKVVFKINILPVVKIISSLFVHMFFIAFMILCFVLYKRPPMISWVQVIYYMLCMVALVAALAFITAPLVIFFRDISQIINIVLQFGMWLTPIMWSVDNLPAGMGGLINVFKLNPMFYIVQGYRNSMIYGMPFWKNSLQTLYFWSLIMVLAVIGGNIYTRLKPHFSDIL